jgi:hypothetical protein
MVPVSKSGIFMKIVINNFYSETHIVKFFTQSHKIHPPFPADRGKMQMLASFLYVYLTLWDAYLKRSWFCFGDCCKNEGKEIYRNEEIFVG